MIDLRNKFTDYLYDRDDRLVQEAPTGSDLHLRRADAAFA
jgi:hypothetical protein